MTYKNTLLLIAIVFIFGCTERSPENIFTAIFDEKPNSLKIIHGKDQHLFDCCLWLHFNIDKKDLQTILSKGFTPKEVNYSKWSHVSPQLEWWTPESFVKTGRYFERISEDERIIESIYTNDTFDEVYYVNYAN